jgi:glycolate oxidase FAD binding subunit
VLEGADSRRCWHEIGGGAALAACEVVWRVAVTPSEAPAVLERLEPERYVVDWGGGLLLAGYSHVDARRVRGAFTTGHATLLKAPAAARAVTPVFQPQAGAVAALAARVREAFDPRGILNPGRMG